MLTLLMLTYCVIDLQQGELAVVSTNHSDQFKIIYKGDLKWNVIVTITNAKDKVVYEREVQNTESFLLPISMSNEESGEYMVKISTPVYDLTKSFSYKSYLDQAASLLEIEYDAELHLIRLTSKEGLKEPFFVFIYNESGDQLITDKVDTKGLTMRTYKLRDAPATQFQILVEMQGTQIRNERFDY
ncbi:MAG: DUF3244 domain-containing protein [Marinoscillum sp.]